MQLQEQARAAEEQLVRERMVEERKRKLQLIEAEKERRAAELRLTEAEQKITELSTPVPVTKKPDVTTPTRLVNNIKD